ncbi:MAG TPA: thioredoxin domain-containing protein [Gemmatimonadaceae bacterium]|nr:thioredoxin domain-containing protein [Gemmatimonadaceae bacterium]
MHWGRSYLMLGLTTAVLGCAAGERRGVVDESGIAYAEGRADAPVQVLYFDDYGCDDCATFAREAVDPLHEQWVKTGRARIEIVDLRWHRGSDAAAAAAACAAEQGEFWPMHALLYERQEIWMRAVDVPAKLRGYASSLGLDTVRFRSCAADPRHQRRMDAAEELARRWSVRGTPAFVVNGKLYYGSQEWSWVEQLLKEAAARDEGSGIGGQGSESGPSSVTSDS